MLLSIHIGGYFVTTDSPSAPAIFQRVMEGVLKDIPGVVVYLDDILITGRTNTDHLKSLQEKTITAGEGRIKKRCSFMGSSVDYLGYQIDMEGLHPLADKVNALKEAPQPRNVTELKSFLGLLTYYGKFLSLIQQNMSWHWGP